MVLLCCASANAYDLEKDGIYYNASTTEEYSLIVTYKSDEFKSYSGDIIIPDTVIVGKKKYAVTAIGLSAFNNCPFLTSVNIPATIKSIGLYAFKGCSSLESIVIPNSVEKIASFAFKSCISLKNVTIEDGETTLEVGYNTTSFMQGGYYDQGPCGLFSSCSIDTAYVGRNISHEYASWSSKYSPFNVVKNVVIGGKVTYLSQSLIYGTPQSVTVLNNIPPTIHENAMHNYSSTTLFVHYPSLETYKSTPVWNNFQTILPYYQDYKVTFMIDNEIIDEIIIKEGSEITPPTAPAKEGHTFTGWIDLPQIMPSEDIIIYGSYEVNYYKLIYIVDNTIHYTSDVAYGSIIEPIDNPQKEGHSFNGWVGLPNTMPANDVVVIGTFSVNSHTVTFMIDGDIYGTVTVKYGAEIELPSVPEKEGYTFSGWSKVPETMPAEDITVEGSFTVNSYTVTFMIDGEIYKTVTVEYGAEIEIPVVVEKEGYIFNGWEDIPEMMPANDIIINGRYMVDTAIGEIIADFEKNEVYNLKGLRITDMNKLTRGIYIINGKKTVVK